MRAFILLLIIISIIPTGINAQKRTHARNQPKELGNVSWYRDYWQALEVARTINKPVLILFQEVPGCATCQQYGKQVLSHPLMVEAIENEFVPVAIFNNKGGDDAQILKRYGEPSWNNPVVRIVNSDGINIVSRVAGNYSTRGLYDAMKQALIAEEKSIPGYMSVLDAEIILASNRGLRTDYYKMYCFWTGEKRLGEAEGVLSTETGFMGGHEVVKVKYDPKFLSKSELNNFAIKSNCSPTENNGGYRRSQKDQYFQIRQTIFKYIPLSGVQKTKINSAMGSSASPQKYLSPTQQKWLVALEESNTAKKELIDIPFQRAWNIQKHEL